MTNRYAGTCHSCGKPVAKGEGDLVKQGRRWLVFHPSCDPDGTARAFANTRSRGYYGRDAGRCEDAPCCGCC